VPWAAGLEWFARACDPHFRAGGIPVRSCQGRGAGEACAGARVNSLGIAGVGLGGELGSVEGIAHMSFGREASLRGVLQVGSQTPKMKSSSNTVLTIMTGQCGRAARTHAAERRTNPDDHRSELLSSVGVGGGASRRFSELVKPATSWSAGC
jgi:hypothetical protein